MAAGEEDPMEDSMARNHTHPGVGELWKATGTLFVGAGSDGRRRAPAGTFLLVIGERRGSIGLQFKVLYPGGVGWVSEHRRLWEAVNDPR
jgi:hypothetical protein